MTFKNEDKFTRKAGIYDKYISSYPAELIDYLYSKIGFSKDSVIADIGSGTGKFSRLLLDKGSTVYCVEPNDDMRQIAENELGSNAGYKDFISINATAEYTGLPEKSIDFITAAMSFHWFNRTKFNIECRRILKENGNVVFVYIIPEKNDFIEKTLAIFDKYRIDPKKPYVTGEPPEDICGFFKNGTCDVMDFRHDALFTRENFIGMILSKAYSPTKEENPSEYHALIKELSILFDGNNIDGFIKDPKSIRSYIGQI